MIRDVLRMGDPRLLVPSRPVEAFATPELAALLADMRETMAAQNGAGLAAPQIGVPLRVVIFGFESNDRYPDADPVPYTELVNPRITPVSSAQEDGWEGCLSVPGLRGVVPRFTQVRYEGFDPHGRPIVREASGFHARVVQHECDHLDGILYPQRMEDHRLLVFVEELQRHPIDLAAFLAGEGEP
jgi:peptide deformylase